MNQHRHRSPLSDAQERFVAKLRDGWILQTGSGWFVEGTIRRGDEWENVHFSTLRALIRRAVVEVDARRSGSIVWKLAAEYE